jgi:hypothetical protein
MVSLTLKRFLQAEFLPHGSFMFFEKRKPRVVNKRRGEVYLKRFETGKKEKSYFRLYEQRTLCS